MLLVSACAISTYNIILLSRAHDRLAANNCRSYGDIVFVVRALVWFLCGGLLSEAPKA